MRYIRFHPLNSVRESDLKDVLFAWYLLRGIHFITFINILVITQIIGFHYIYI